MNVLVYQIKEMLSPNCSGMERYFYQLIFLSTEMMILSNEMIVFCFTKTDASELANKLTNLSRNQMFRSRKKIVHVTRVLLRSLQNNDGDGNEHFTPK